MKTFLERYNESKSSNDKFERHCANGGIDKYFRYYIGLSHYGDNNWFIIDHRQIRITFSTCWGVYFAYDYKRKQFVGPSKSLKDLVCEIYGCCEDYWPIEEEQDIKPTVFDPLSDTVEPWETSENYYEDDPIYNTLDIPYSED